MRGSKVGLAGALALAAATVTPIADVDAQEGVVTCAGRSITIFGGDDLTIVGTDGPDVILGGPGPNNIRAGGGADVVCGGDGVDFINGGAGRDILRGQGENDFFEAEGPARLADDALAGGVGRDTADYTGSPVGVRVDLRAGVVTAVGASTAQTIAGVEFVDGSHHADELLGSPGVVRIEGKGGNDVIGSLGAGAESFEGEGGLDRLTYRSAPQGVRIEVGIGRNNAYIGPHIEGFSGFESFEGSPFADRIIGGHDNDHFLGAGGDDVLKGKYGDDVLEGGGGDDVIHPGPDDDFVDGGTNDPVTSAAEHGDLVSYQGDAVVNSDSLYLYLQTSPPFWRDPPGSEGAGGHDDFVGIESARGTKLYENWLVGDPGPNVLIGGDRFDQLVGLQGNDLLYGLGRFDVLFGGGDDNIRVTNDGDDYLDGGLPNGEGDSDILQGGDGFDTCTGAHPEFAACSVLV